VEVHEKGRVTLRLLRMCVISLSAVFYGAKFHYAPSPTALSFIPHILLQRLLPLFECFVIYVKFDLSMVPPSPQPSPLPPITVGHPSSLWRGGVVAHPLTLTPRG
jgi:hypothetical protein